MRSRVESAGEPRCIFRCSRNPWPRSSYARNTCSKSHSRGRLERRHRACRGGSQSFRTTGKASIRSSRPGVIEVAKYGSSTAHFALSPGSTACLAVDHSEVPAQLLHARISTYGSSSGVNGPDQTGARVWCSEHLPENVSSWERLDHRHEHDTHVQAHQECFAIHRKWESRSTSARCESAPAQPRAPNAERGRAFDHFCRQERTAWPA